jgi:branched-subunit amino acid ABC-type transport system permease component
LIIACVVAAALNFVIEKVAYRPLRNSPKLAPLITAIGMSILLADAGDDHLQAELQAVSRICCPPVPIDDRRRRDHAPRRS